MTTSKTPVTLTEMPTFPADGPADQLVARFARWEDAAEIAARWSAANDGKTFFQVRFNDGFTIATENFLRGSGGDYIEVPTAKGRKLRAAFER